MSLIFSPDWADPVFESLTLRSIIMLYHTDRATRTYLIARLKNIREYVTKMREKTPLGDLIAIYSKLDMKEQLICCLAEMSSKPRRDYDAAMVLLGRELSSTGDIEVLEMLMYHLIVVEMKNHGHSQRSYVTKLIYLTDLKKGSNSLSIIERFLEHCGLFIESAIIANRPSVIKMILRSVHISCKNRIFDMGLDAASRCHNIPAMEYFIKNSENVFSNRMISALTLMDNDELFDRYTSMMTLPSYNTDYYCWSYVESSLKVAIQNGNEHIMNGILSLIGKCTSQSVTDRLMKFCVREISKLSL